MNASAIIIIAIRNAFLLLCLLTFLGGSADSLNPTNSQVGDYLLENGQHALINATYIRSEMKNAPFRRRLRRRRKRKHSTTTEPPTTTLSLSTTWPKQLNINYNSHQTKVKRKQKKKINRHNDRSQKTDNFLIKKNFLHAPQLVHYPEPRNLILPITPKSVPTLHRINKEKELLLEPGHKNIRKTRCSVNNGGCAHICNVNGNTKCECFKGFRLLKDHHGCTDINECLTNNGGCQMACSNSLGSYHCHCPHGFRLGIDSKTCEDVNECLLRNGHGPCQDICINTKGGYKCSCDRLKGTILANNLHTCVDVDECAQSNGGCSHICLNTFGRSFCSCPVGMELSDDFKTCQDINECNSEIVKNECLYGCVNTIGSYNCTSIQQLQSDEAYKKITCTPLFPPENGYFKCSRKRALNSVTKSGRIRIKNSPGTKCTLVCPEGFVRSGKRYRLKCNYEGQWIGDMNAKCVQSTDVM